MALGSIIRTQDPGFTVAVPASAAFVDPVDSPTPPRIVDLGIEMEVQSGYQTRVSWPIPISIARKGGLAASVTVLSVLWRSFDLYIHMEGEGRYRKADFDFTAKTRPFGAEPQTFLS